MSIRKRGKIKQKQKAKRRKRLKKLREKGLNAGEYYSKGFYIGPKPER